MSFWLERLSILLQIYTFACNFCSRKGGRASIGYRASIGTYTVCVPLPMSPLHPTSILNGSDEPCINHVTKISTLTNHTRKFFSRSASALNRFCHSCIYTCSMAVYVCRCTIIKYYITSIFTSDICTINIHYKLCSAVIYVYSYMHQPCP